MPDQFNEEQVIEELRAFYEEQRSSGEPLYFNGIDGATGEYGVPPITGEELARIIQGESRPENLGELRHKQGSDFPIKPPNDPTRLDEAGWAVVLSEKAKPAIKEALTELLQHRQDQAGDRYQVYDGSNGYKTGETKAQFLRRHKVSGGPADPEQMPYYVLLVGNPDEIPYEFQYQLDVMRGVGRIHFDTPDEYASYARNVVMAEAGQVKLPRRASFFGVANPDDRATELSAKYLIRPLYEKLRQQQPFSLTIDDGVQRTKLALDWQFESFVAERANKARLERLLGGDQTPTLLFTASHGMQFPAGDDRQVAHQGALLCQDWPGPKQHRGQIPQDWYFSGDDLASDARILGLITFHFACFSAGTPRLDQFARQAFRDEREIIAPHNFIGGLPKSLLSRGALAVIGHVERAWGYSILSQGVDQTGIFEAALLQLLRGVPVGLVIEELNMRYADLATQLTDVLEFDKDTVDPYELAQMWTEHNDARSYVALGDPAARLPFALPGEKPTPRPAVLPMSTAPSTPKAQAEAAPVESRGAPSEHGAPLPGDTAVDFGIQMSDLTGSIKQFTNQLASALGKAAANITTLEVKTYTTDDIDTVAQGDESRAKLRAYSRVAFDGDMQVYVPMKVGGVDEELWKIHAEMVREAQANRAQFLQSMAELATNLLKNLKP